MLATWSSEARLASRPGRPTAKLSKTSEASESTVGSDAAGLAAVVAHRTLVSAEVGECTKTTEARLMHGVATKSKTWKRCARNVGGVLFLAIVLGAVIRRLVGIGVGWALRVVACRDTRTARCLLVGLQEARPESTSVIGGHAKGTKAKVTIASA